MLGQQNIRPSLSEQPAWLESQNKKRTIPNHLVSRRKTGFQISTSAQSKKDIKNGDYLQSSNSFNLVSFGGSPRKLTLESRSSTNNGFDTTVGDLTKYDETNKTINDEMSSYEFDNDLPPMKSIYDLNDELLLSLDEPTHSNILNKDPKSFNNVFNHGNDQSIPIDKKEDKIVNPLEHGESGILVFGYPENMSNQVIQHFQQFGNVLEDFEVNRKKKTFFQSNEKIFPCFMGPSWVKITYDNPASAMDSLQENGSIFNGVLLGVIPYTKDAIEKLQNRKLSDNEDIGSIGERKKPENDTHPIHNTPQTQSNLSTLEVKNNNVFLQENGTVDPAKSNSKEKLGFWDNTMKFLFGFNEL